MTKKIDDNNCKLTFLIFKKKNFHLPSACQCFRHKTTKAGHTREDFKADVHPRSWPVLRLITNDYFVQKIHYCVVWCHYDY